MTRDALSNSYQPVSLPAAPIQASRNIYDSQESVYSFLLEIVNKWSPETVLLEFKKLFITYENDAVNGAAIAGISDIIFANSEVDFRDVLKRSCYILINNWEAKRQYRVIKELIEVFTELKNNRETFSRSLGRVRSWLNNFLHSQDYQELKLFTARYESGEKSHWSHRYTSYLLVPQYVDLNNSPEQREAARVLSQQLKDKFKFDLAMYTAHTQLAVAQEKAPKNPTGLGDEILRLIKLIVAKRGSFSYKSLANIFLDQTREISYKDFKESIQKYLTFGLASQDFVEIFQKKLTEKLENLYQDKHEEVLDSSLFLRTCNRLIEHLTTENRGEPSPLFILLMSQGNPLTLVTVLLKIILISKNSRTHLEACIAALIKHYMEYPEDDCKWVVNFFEIFNITFAIHAENVQYNLIKVNNKAGNGESEDNLSTYRVFSQLKSHRSQDDAKGIAPEEFDISDRQ